MSSATLPTLADGIQAAGTGGRVEPDLALRAVGRTAHHAGVLDRFQHRVRRADDQLDALNADAGTVLRWASQAIPRFAATSSFGVDSAVLLHLLSVHAPRTPVIFLDTGLHFDETLAYRDRLAGHFDLTVISVTPSLTVADQEALFSARLSSTDPDTCCMLRKDLPLTAALAAVDGWASGVRRGQTTTRAGLPLVGTAVKGDRTLVKVAPLAAWTADDVATYRREHDLPRPPAGGPGLPLHRVLAVHPCDHARRGPPSRSLGRPRARRVRHPRRRPWPTGARSRRSRARPPTGPPMSQFGYVMALDLHDQRAVLVGGGREAVTRLAALLAAGARVDVVTPDPSPELERDLTASDGHAALHRRDYRPGDLADARLAIATGEDAGTDIEALWSESRERHVMTSVLDDLDHTDFAQPALVRRGDLRIAISTGGSAPALARRYREDLEQHYGPEHGELVAAAAEARSRAGVRPVSFEQWAGRWSCAVWDVHGLARRIRHGEVDAVVDGIVSTLLPAPPLSVLAHDDAPRPRPTKAESDPTRRDDAHETRPEDVV